MKSKKVIVITLIAILTTGLAVAGFYTIMKAKNKTIMSTADMAEMNSPESEQPEHETPITDGVNSAISKNAETKPALPKFPIISSIPSEVEKVREENPYSGTLLYSDGVLSYFDDSKWETTGKCQAFYLDMEGTLLTSGEFDMAYPFHEGYGCVSRDGKYGFIDKKGQ